MRESLLDVKRMLFVGLALALLSGCAAYMPNGKGDAVAARANASTEPLNPDINGLDCLIVPLRDGINPLGAPLRGIYRVSADRMKASFALVMPQGSKIGQCRRENGGSDCSTGRIPYSRDMAEQSFEGINMLMGAASGRGGLEPGEGVDNFVYQRKNSSWKFELRVLEFKNGG